MRVSSFQHPEADGVPAAQELLRRIDADVEVIGEQVVVGAVAAVLGRGARLRARESARRQRSSARGPARLR